jgi:CRP/FNR family transcriptional regulator, cyclic AMP receptor protein
MKQPTMPTAANLGRQPFFRGIPWPQLEALASVAACADFAAGEAVFREGEEANRFYLLLTGRVALEATTADRQVQLQVVEAGEALGWSWVFPPFRWQFSARAVEPVHAFFFHAETLRQRLDDDPVLGHAVMKRVANVLFERLQSARQRLAVVEQAAAGRPIRLVPLAPATPAA